MTHSHRYRNPIASPQHHPNLITEEGNPMNRTIRWRGGVAITAAVAAATLGLAAPAFAATPTSNIDPAHAISLTITKLTNGDTVAPGDNNGTEQDTTGAHPVQGAGFTIYPVTKGGNPIKLSTNAGWQDAAALAATLDTSGWSGLTSADDAAGDIAGVSGYDVDNGIDNGNGLTADDSLTGTTDVAGEVSWSNATPDGTTWSDLQMGLYLVVETTKPDDATAPIVPFLVTVPMTNPTESAPSAGDQRTTWNYAVHAYPKNAINSLTKSVNDANALVGENSAADSVTKGERLQYKLSASIPDYDTDTHDSAVLSDTFPSQVDVSQVNDTDPADDDTVAVTVDGTPLTPTTDYTVGVSGQVVTVTLTASGLAALDSHPGDVLAVTIPAIAKSAGADIVNGDHATTPASIDFTGTGGETTTVEVKTPAHTKYGLLTLTKFEDANGDNAYNAGDGDTLIQGAVFELYTSTTDDFSTAAVYTQGDDDPDSATPSDPVTFTTNASGQLTALLRYNTGTGANTTQDVYYWLVETQATSGHELLAEPIEVTVNSAAVSLDVQNPKTNAGFSLPLTGGFGTFVFYAVGGGIVALTIILLLVLGARRRKEHAQH